MAPHQTSTRTGRVVIIVDGLGCLAASLAVLTSPRLVMSIDPSMRSRRWVAGALGATGALMTVTGYRSDGPTALRIAALTNAGWVVACLAALPGRSGWGRRIVCATTILDASMGVAQWRLAATTTVLPHPGVDRGPTGR